MSEIGSVIGFKPWDRPSKLKLVFLDGDDEVLEVTAPVENRELLLQIALYDVGITLTYSARNIEGAACCIVGNTSIFSAASIGVELRALDGLADGTQLVSNWTLYPEESSRDGGGAVELRVQKILKTLVVL
mmetsp:Transcript_22372/g.47020  ORF Transcript_22372/g.47020 Transcript_22372/m.47020 type:complete len:131 (+) Transcript_22372:244-636(+)|eukprot:CAMPEP_0171330314 /NCGR_PEP_ID=MMETSP0878-20121228/1927_1 /TAXON_ID=67004 /ORGANISM="Thalassiosira weissflogii, Strain CCMP1336" /LENGTH=130 /DNA_ID=CAMNT_0011830587 /DNA_START=186 /DNA_END=578 /DNA_ORIENTATION=+